MDDENLIAIIKGNPGITHLNLEDCHKLTGASLNVIVTELKELVWLKAKGCKTLTEDFTEIRALKEMKLLCIDLSETDVSDAKLQILVENLPKLKSILLKGKKLFLNF